MKLISTIITILLLAATLIQSMQLKSTAKFKMVALRNEYRDFSLENVKEMLGELNSGPYSLRRLLGKGGFGQVYKITETNSPNKSYAFKIIDYKKRKGMDSDTKRLTIDEINFLDKFKGNKYVSQLIDAFDHKSNEAITMVMELMDTDLEKCITDKKCYNERIGSNKTWLLAKLISGLNSIHKQNVAHLDIKPENIMLRGKEPVYADFGLALNIQEGEIADEFRGTPGYIDVNVYNKVNPKHPGLGLKSDIYSLGIVFLQVIDRNFFLCLYYSTNCTKENQYLSNIIEKKHDYSVFDHFCKLEDIDLRTKEDDFLNCLVVNNMLVPYEKRKSLDDLYEMLYNYENREEILRQEEERKQKEAIAKAKLEAEEERRQKEEKEAIAKAKLEADRETKAKGEAIPPKETRPKNIKALMDVMNKAKKETGYQAKTKGKAIAAKKKETKPEESITIRDLVNKAKETYSEAKRKQENKEAPKKDYKPKPAKIKEEIKKPKHNQLKPDRPKMLKNTLQDVLNAKKDHLKH